MQYIYMSDTPFAIVVRPRIKLNLTEEEIQDILKQIERELKDQEIKKVVDIVEP